MTGFILSLKMTQRGPVLSSHTSQRACAYLSQLLIAPAQQRAPAGLALASGSAQSGELTYNSSLQTQKRHSVSVQVRVCQQLTFHHTHTHTHTRNMNITSSLWANAAACKTNLLQVFKLLFAQTCQTDQ